MSITSALGGPIARKILVVDDEQTILTTLRELLTLKGFLVTATNDPQQAMAIMQQEAFAVVMTDHDMPGMTGLALLAKMRELYPATPRVLVTGAKWLPPGSRGEDAP